MPVGSNHPRTYDIRFTIADRTKHLRLLARQRQSFPKLRKQQSVPIRRKIPACRPSPLIPLRNPENWVHSLGGFAVDGNTGEKLADVRVTTEPPSETVKTDSSGDYMMIKGFHDGPYRVIGRKEGYRIATADVILSGRLFRHADLLMVPDNDTAEGRSAYREDRYHNDQDNTAEGSYVPHGETDGAESRDTAEGGSSWDEGE